MNARTDSEDPSPARKRRRRWPRVLMMVLGPLLLLGGGSWYYLSTRGYVSTEDAYVQRHRVTISAQVNGRVLQVPVHDNEAVRRGQVLLRLDPDPFTVALDAARAHLAAVTEQVEGLKARYHALEAQILAARDQAAYLARTVRRQEALARRNLAAAAKLDQARTDAEAARQQVAILAAQRKQLLTQLGGDPNEPLAHNAAYRAAQAAKRRAELDLSYTVIRAPAAGIVARVTLRPGDLLSARSAAFALMESGSVWIRANFKETDLGRMRVGDPATVTVDSYPGRTWHGRVQSISPGSGSVFALLPAENATGNWVKVVQRFPVRIAIEGNGEHPYLRAGMSAGVRVKVATPG